MRNALVTAVRFSFFSATREEMLRFGAQWRYSATGLMVTWIVGIGRWWDHDDAGIFQKLGLRSLVYVFVLAFFLWVVVMPMRPRNWTYPCVLVCVTFTALPGIIYATPIEWFLSSERAARANLGFLAFVASWRVALLIFFVRRLGELSWSKTLAGTLFPLNLVVCIVSASVSLNMSLLRDMAGVKNFSDEQLAVEAAANVVSEVSSPLFVPLLLAYGSFAIIPLIELYRRNDEPADENATH